MCTYKCIVGHGFVHFNRVGKVQHMDKYDLPTVNNDYAGRHGKSGAVGDGNYKYGLGSDIICLLWKTAARPHIPKHPCLPIPCLHLLVSEASAYEREKQLEILAQNIKPERLQLHRQFCVLR